MRGNEYVRTGNDTPATSVAAAIKAAQASTQCVAEVRRVMLDGAGRTDEELWQACRANQYLRTKDTVRHGRLALSTAGLLADTGEVRPTSNGMDSRVWAWVGSRDEIDLTCAVEASRESAPRAQRALVRLAASRARLAAEQKAVGEYIARTVVRPACKRFGLRFVSGDATDPGYYFASLRPGSPPIRTADVARAAGYDLDAEMDVLRTWFSAMVYVGDLVPSYPADIAEEEDARGDE